MIVDEDNGGVGVNRTEEGECLRCEPDNGGGGGGWRRVQVFRSAPDRGGEFQE